MAQNCVTVVEIGSSKLSCIIAERGLNNTFIVKAKASVEYAGFFEGEFVESAYLVDAVLSLFSQISSTYKKKIKKVFVGVPAEFSKVVTCEEQMNFKFKHSINKNDIDFLFNQASINHSEEDMEVVTVNPISYTLDDSKNIQNPLKQKSYSLGAELSIIMVQSHFVKTFNKIWTRVGIEQVEYLSEPLCESMFILSKEERERTCIVIDVGARSTSVSFVKGDALTNLTSFSMGGSYITSDLSEACGISYGDARNLKKEIVLSVRGDKDDFYELMTLGGKIIRIPLNYVNEAVCYRIGIIASTINECIRLFAKEYVPFYPIYLCGAGITKIKGGKDYLAKCLGRNVSYGIPPVPSMDKPELASILGLINFALNSKD